MKIGLVGFGFMGKSFMHSLALINHYYKKYIPEVEISGIVTSSEESSKNIDLKRYGIERAYKNFNELVSNKDIDSIYIASPNSLHAEQLLAAIKADKNILCDKPLTVNSKQSKKIIDILRKDKIYQMMFEYRNFPAIREIKSLIENKKIGEIINFKASYLHGSYLDRDRPMSWRLREGGGAVSDLAPHVIDLCNFLVGDIKTLRGFKRNIIPRRPKSKKSKILEKVLVDDHASCLCKTHSGVTGILDVSRVSMGSIDELTLIINGTDGTLKWNLEELNFYQHLTNEGSKKIFAINSYNDLADFPPEKVSSGWLRAHTHSVYQFIARSSQIKLPRKEMSYIPSFADGHKVQSLLESFNNYSKFF